MNADERTNEGAGEAVEDLRNVEGNRGETAVPAWVPNAWEMRIVGMQSWENIGAAVGHKWDTVKRWVTAYSQMLGEVADNEPVIHARAEYVASLQRIKRQAEEVVLAAAGKQDAQGNLVGAQPFAKIGALNTKLRASEKLAAAKGVVTERKGTELSTKPDDPLLAILERFTAQQIGEELNNGRFAGDAGGGVGRDAAPGGGEAPAGEGEV